MSESHGTHQKFVPSCETCQREKAVGEVLADVEAGMVPRAEWDRRVKEILAARGVELLPVNHVMTDDATPLFPKGKPDGV